MILILSWNNNYFRFVPLDENKFTKSPIDDLFKIALLSPDYLIWMFNIVVFRQNITYPSIWYNFKSGKAIKT